MTCSSSQVAIHHTEILQEQEAETIFFFVSFVEHSSLAPANRDYGCLEGPRLVA